MMRRDADWTERPERGNLFVLRLMLGITRRAGPHVARALLWPIALYFWVFSHAARRDSIAYLRRVVGNRRVVWHSLRHFHTFARTLLDRVFLLSGGPHACELVIHGEEHLEAALAARAGSILVGAHLGSFEAMRAAGRAQPGLRVTLAMYEENAQKIGGFLRALDPQLEDDIVSLGRVDAMLKLQQRLERGDFVGLLADRTFGHDTTVEQSFLGAPAQFPIGIFRLAAVLRRPVLMMAALYTGGNRYDIYVEPLIDFSQSERRGRNAQVGEAVARYAQLLEQHCRRAPYNWFNFYDFWRKPAGVVPRADAAPARNA